jgi:tryptophan synthase alpha chain
MKIEKKFKQLKEEKKKAFIAYIPFGFPEIQYTKDIILALQKAGVDIIEVGIPFSDPLADGPIIQKANYYALKGGATSGKLFGTLEDIRGSIKIPLVVMTYYNPIFRFGMKKFFKKMRELSVSGIMVVDLPFEESKEYVREARNYELETVFFITPTTSLKRVKDIVKVSKGFIYYISVTGITGPKLFPYQPLVFHINTIKRFTDLPLCIGFGIYTHRQVKEIGEFSDGVIVGSSIVRFIEKHYRRRDFLIQLNTYVNSLIGRR